MTRESPGEGCRDRQPWCRTALHPEVDARSAPIAVPSQRGRGAPGRPGETLLVPAALAAVGTSELAALGTSGWVAAAGLEVVAAGVLVFRRPFPLVAAPLAAILILAIPYTGTRMDEPATPIIFYIVAIYTLGRYAGLRGGPVALVLTLLLVFADLYFVNSEDNDVTDIMFVLSLAIPPYIFGRVTRKLAEQSEQLKRQQELIRDQATRDERDRIARELHDVIAHSLSAMVVQTAAAQDLVRSHPDRAAELLESVAETGRKALAETGRLLHLIRDDADELGLRPAPGLADVPELVDDLPRERARRRGRPRPAAEVPLPGGVDVSAYRVVQEALTNALKYGDGTVRLQRRLADRTGCGSRARTRSAARACQRFRPRSAGHGRAGRPARRDAAARADTGRPASWSTSTIPLPRGALRDPGRGRRRPGAGPVRPAAGARGARLRGRRHGGRRPRGRRGGAPHRAGRRADGHPDARAGRDRGHPRAHRGRLAEQGAGADDVRPRPLRVRRPRRRRRRVPAQGHAAGPAGRGHPHRLRGRVAARAEPDPAADRGVPPAPAAGRPASRASSASSPTASGRCWC